MYVDQLSAQLHARCDARQSSHPHPHHTGARHEASAAQTQLSSVRQDLADVSAARHRAEASTEQLRGEVAGMEAEVAECSAQEAAVNEELRQRVQEMAEAGRMEEILRGRIKRYR